MTSNQVSYLAEKYYLILVKEFCSSNFKKEASKWCMVNFERARNEIERAWRETGRPSPYSFCNTFSFDYVVKMKNKEEFLTVAREVIKLLEESKFKDIGWMKIRHLNMGLTNGKIIFNIAINGPSEHLKFFKNSFVL